MIPDSIHRPSLFLKMPAGGRILGPVPVCEQPGDRIVGMIEVNN